jgi:hypothetical protein
MRTRRIRNSFTKINFISMMRGIGSGRESLRRRFNDGATRLSLRNEGTWCMHFAHESTDADSSDACLRVIALSTGSKTRQSDRLIQNLDTIFLQDDSCNLESFKEFLSALGMWFQGNTTLIADSDPKLHVTLFAVVMLPFFVYRIVKFQSSRSQSLRTDPIANDALQLVH